jgi:hypothetical protein
MAEQLPFTYMLPEDTRKSCGFGTINGMQRATREGRFVAPDYINGRARYRSDLVAQWLREQAERSDQERAEKARLLREKGQRMRAARRDQQPEAA